MADFADIAAAREAEIIADALAARRSAPAPGATAKECQECGEPIPEARRRAQPGCTRCTECQEHFDRQIA